MESRGRAASGPWSVLIVDDEAEAVEAIVKTVRWDILGVGRIETAYSSFQARQIFDRAPVDLLLCDIEMPQGSGLDLLGWVRERYPETACVFVTCHAEFRYAKEALRLGSLDYLLKPVPYAELEKAMAGAFERIAAARRSRVDERDALMWKDSRGKMLADFWREYLAGGIAGDEGELLHRAISLGAPADFASAGIACGLVKLRQVPRGVSGERGAVLSILAGDLVREVFSATLQATVIRSSDTETLVLLPLGGAPEVGKSSLWLAASKVVDLARQRLDCSVACYLGLAPSLGALRALFSELRGLDKENVTEEEGLFSAEDSRRKRERRASLAELPEMRTWAAALAEGREEVVTAGVETFLRAKSASGQMSADLLRHFRQDFLQSSYAALKSSGIRAHRVFANEESEALFVKATGSVVATESWVSFVARKVKEAILEDKNRGDPVERAKRAIMRNLSGELTRESVAEQVGLNPDYLNRLFRASAGLSLMEWAVERKLDYAYELLRDTAMSVSDVALQVGYSNFSHFASIFKKRFSANPSEIRAKSDVPSVSR